MRGVSGCHRNRRFLCVLLGTLCWPLLCAPCTPAATVGQDETSNPGPAQRVIELRRLEERAGQTMALRLEQRGSLLQDPRVLAYVNRVAQRVLANSESDQQVRVRVLVQPAFSAFSLPGGRIYLTVGLLKRLGSEDELAAVLAHEIAHATAHDWAHQRSRLILLRARQRAVWRGIPARGMAGFDRSGASANVLAAWRTRAEVNADDRGLDFLYRAGYDPSAFVSLLNKVSTFEQQNPLGPQDHARNYRGTVVRITAMENRLSSLPARKRRNKKRSRGSVRMERRLGVVMKR